MTENLPAVFEFGDRDVRVVMIGGEPWFVLADVIRVLGLSSRPAQVAQRLPEGVRRTDTLQTAGGPQQVILISEAGLYRVVLRSDAPNADRFIQWVTEDLIPTVRKKGAYLTPAALADPANLIQMLQNWQVDKERADRAEIAVRTVTGELEVVKPKADAWEAFMEKCPGDMSVAEAAKYLVNAGITIGQNRLYEWMRNNGWVYRLQTQNGVTGHKPYQHRVEAKHLRPGIKTIERGSRVIAHHEIRVTPRGLDLLRRQLLAGNVVAIPALDVTA